MRSAFYGWVFQFNSAVIVQDERGDFAVGFAEGEAVEPELVVLAVGEPATGGFLFELDNGAGDIGGPRKFCGGNLASWVTLGL